MQINLTDFACLVQCVFESPTSAGIYTAHLSSQASVSGRSAADRSEWHECGIITLAGERILCLLKDERWDNGGKRHLLREDRSGRRWWNDDGGVESDEWTDVLVNVYNHPHHRHIWPQVSGQSQTFTLGHFLYQPLMTLESVWGQFLPSANFTSN